MPPTPDPLAIPGPAHTPSAGTAVPACPPTAPRSGAPQNNCRQTDVRRPQMKRPTQKIRGFAITALAYFLSFCGYCVENPPADKIDQFFKNWNPNQACGG